MGIHGEGTISSVVGLTYFMTLIAKGAHKPAEGAMVPTAQYGFLYNGESLRLRGSRNRHFKAKPRCGGSLALSPKTV